MSAHDAGSPLAPSPSPSPVSLSVVIPVCNEAGVIASLSAEIDQAFATSGVTYEVIWVDDGSTDGTGVQLSRLPPAQRSITLTSNCGKSAAYVAGFRSAVGDWVATLDGDGQDVPDDLLILVRKVMQGDVDAIVGVRTTRTDSFIRRISSRIGNLVRRIILGDRFRDVGCGVRVGRRAVFDGLPDFAGMHRFIPVFMESQGFRVLEETVRNRARQGGRSKYGIINRLPAGLCDLMGVRWLLHRRRHWRVVVTESQRSHSRQGDTATPPEP